MLDQTPAQGAEAESWIDKLQAAADGAAGEVRNLYIAFLSFGLYLAITVGANRRLAQRLTLGDPQACPRRCRAAGGSARSSRTDRRPPRAATVDEAELPSAPPDAPLQEPQPFVPYQ